MLDKVFWQKFNKDKKIVDLSVMPPCKTNLSYHIMRANYIAFLFRQADHLVMNLESPEGHGWDADGKVIWSNVPYPDEMNELLLIEESEESDCDELEDDVDVEISISHNSRFKKKWYNQVNSFYFCNL